jgi:hypothetical protein
MKNPGDGGKSVDEGIQVSLRRRLNWLSKDNVVLENREPVPSLL